MNGCRATRPDPVAVDLARLFAESGAEKCGACGGNDWVLLLPDGQFVEHGLVTGGIEGRFTQVGRLLPSIPVECRCCLTIRFIALGSFEDWRKGSKDRAPTEVKSSEEPGS